MTVNFNRTPFDSFPISFVALSNVCEQSDCNHFAVPVWMSEEEHSKCHFA